MRRKRRNRGTWFPILGHDAGEGGFGSLTREFIVDAPGNGDPTLVVLPVTYDFPIEAPELTQGLDSLADILGSEYIVKRILGSIHLSYDGRLNANTDDHSAPSVLVTAGLFVARANPNTAAPSGAAVPIGFGINLQTDLENYSPASTATAREPWMWRRTWILGNERLAHARRTSTATANVGMSGGLTFPGSNAGYGTMRSGPDVDVKSRRRVRQDERLWLAIEVRNLTMDSVFDFDGFVLVDITLRMYGNLVKARQGGAF